LRFGFLLQPGFPLTAFAAFIDTLRLASEEGPRGPAGKCTWRVLGATPEPVMSSCGVAIPVTGPAAEPERFDYVVVIGGPLRNRPPPNGALASFLRRAAASEVGLVGVCTGAFLLAGLGLMEGHRACVSWFHRDDYLARFPHLPVVADRLFIVDGRRITCASGASAIHLAGHLLERHGVRAGARASVRQMMVHSPPGGMAPEPEGVDTCRARDPVVVRAMLWIEQTLADGSRLAQLGDELGISTRQLQRRFVADVGISPQDYRARLRLLISSRMLETSELSVGQIGLQCGFADGAHFSRTFRRAFRSAPSEVRSRAAALASEP
jgi:transcriptional regulator GlxA family with amidase domain